MYTLFFKLLRFAIGAEKSLGVVPNKNEWQELFILCRKHSLLGVAFQGVERLQKTEAPDFKLLMKWIAITQRIKSMNALQNLRCKELTEIFKKAGFRTCILKGQGTSLLYPKPEYRQCGDIDIWVEGEREAVIDFAKQSGINIRSIDIQHSEMDFFNDVPVEVHFTPSYTFNFVYGKRLEEWTNKMADSQFANYDEAIGFVRPTVEFNLVFSLMHIYRHLFSEGIGLRQLLDYYYILKESTKEQRHEAYMQICQFGMKDFAGAVMFVLRQVFVLDNDLMLCPINNQYGDFLLNEILIAGNFGHYDDRYKLASKQKKFLRGINQFKRNWCYVHYYPQEVLWSPIWKLWHWGWRKWNGYI